jgi:hypothetical protein
MSPNSNDKNIFNDFFFFKKKGWNREGVAEPPRGGIRFLVWGDKFIYIFLISWGDKLYKYNFSICVFIYIYIYI